MRLPRKRLVGCNQFLERFIEFQFFFTKEIEADVEAKKLYLNLNDCCQYTTKQLVKTLQISFEILLLHNIALHNDIFSNMRRELISFVIV